MKDRGLQTVEDENRPGVRVNTNRDRLNSVETRARTQCICLSVCIFARTHAYMYVSIAVCLNRAVWMCSYGRICTSKEKVYP